MMAALVDEVVPEFNEAAVASRVQYVAPAAPPAPPPRAAQSQTSRETWVYLVLAGVFALFSLVIGRVA